MWGEALGVSYIDLLLDFDTGPHDNVIYVTHNARDMF